jgi:uncharacterized alpha-E superfamily protein
MSRYIERAENVARFIDVNLHLMLDLPVVVEEQWLPLVKVTGDHASFAEKYGDATEDRVIRFLAFDANYPNSIVSSLAAARENARTIREIISSEMWEQINRFYLFVRSAQPDGRSVDEPHEFFEQIKRDSALFWGITDATMSREAGWHFTRLARLIERADKTSRIVDVKYFILLPQVGDVGSPFDNIQWAALLKSASALEMYRKRHRRILPRDVARFLTLDRTFPRSIHYCLIKAEESLLAITGSSRGTYRTTAEQQLGRLRAELDYADIDEIIRHGLHEYIDGFQRKLNHVGDAIRDTFFAPRPVGTPGRSGEEAS